MRVRVVTYSRMLVTVVTDPHGWPGARPVRHSYRPMMSCTRAPLHEWASQAAGEPHERATRLQENPPKTHERAMSGP